MSDGEVDYPLVTALDYLVIMDQIAAHASIELLIPGAIVIIDSSCVKSPPQGDFKVCSFPLTDIKTVHTTITKDNHNTTVLHVSHAAIEKLHFCGVTGS